MVILGAQTLYTAGTMLEMAHLLRRKQIPLGFGGAVFNKIEGAQRCIPGHFLGGNLQKTPETVELLLQKNPPLPEIREASPAYHETLAHFREKRPAIEAHVYHFVDKNHLGFIDLSGANEDLGNNITGALTLGNMELLTTNIEWVRGLLMNYHYRMPADAVGHYIATYYRATQIHLDERGKPIQEWFERLIVGNNNN
jgi:hypothetical protein